MSETQGKPAILGGKATFDEVIPITSPSLPLLDDLREPLNEILSTGQLTNGKYVEKFENECADYLGSKFAVAVSSCTLGLILVEQALGLKGEVLIPSFTFSATGHSLLWNNLRPFFVDCELESHNVDPILVEKSVTPRTSAILAVDVFGNPCDREALCEIARKRGLKLIIDCAHSLGSLYGGKKFGGFADAQVFSLSPTKVVVAGEGGMVITDNRDLAGILRIARNYGNPGDYDCEFAGLNARMEEFNAILGIESLNMVEATVGRRNALAAVFRSQLAKLPGISFQEVESGSRSTYKDFSILVDEERFGLDRNLLGRALERENIETRPYFEPPLHRQKAYKALGLPTGNKLPNTEFLSSHALSLPLFAHMKEETLEKICAAFEGIHEHAEEIKRQMANG